METLSAQEVPQQPLRAVNWSSVLRESSVFVFFPVCTYVMRVLGFLCLRCSSRVSERKTTAMSDADYCQPREG